MRIGTSQWLFEESRNTSSSSLEYQSAGCGVAGSSGKSAPGMSFQRNRWPVRMSSYAIGNREYTAMPSCPGKAPNPKASSGPPTEPLLLRSKPEGMPVLDGATNE